MASRRNFRMKAPRHEGRALRGAEPIVRNGTTTRPGSGPVRQQSTHWVFGYGSLIWRPGFEYIRALPALMHGAHRSLCIYSHRHRGTPDQPGLVFGLVRGGSCRGMAFEVEPARWDEVHAYLYEREMDRGVYREAVRPVRLADGTLVQALAFLVDERHVQFAGKLEIAEQA